MINDKHKSQTKNIHQTPIWRQWIKNTFPMIQNPKLENQISQRYFQVEKYRSQQTIKSSQMQHAVQINYPNYSLYPTQHQMQQKMVISKSELVSFTQLFAQQKISLQFKLRQLRMQNDKMIKQLYSLREQSDKFSQNLTKAISIKFQQQIKTSKAKCKNQMQIKNNMEKQLNIQKSKTFEINKKNEFLQQKIKYQQDQIKRFQHLLKIKEEIIQNFQWEKSVAGSRKIEKSMKSGNQVQLMNRVRNQIEKNRVNSRQMMRTQLNQSLDLSQINFNQNNLSSFDITYKQQQETRVNNPAKKYKIGKKPFQKGDQQKTKLNISLHKFTQNGAQQPQKTSQKQFILQKSRPKNIIIKRSANNSSFVNDNALQNLIRQKEQRIRVLQKTIKQKQIQYIKIVSLLKRQNDQLNKKIFSLNISQEEQSLLKSKQNSIQSQIETRNKLQRKNNMLKQKCILLQNQIQKTIRKYIMLEQRNTQLETVIQSLRLEQSQSQYFDKQNQEEGSQSRPSLSLKDLMTPQFRQTRFNNNFFAKNKQAQTLQEPFENIELPASIERSKFYDTFNRNKGMNTDLQNKQYEKLDSKNVIKQFKGNDKNTLKNSIQEVSQIACNNEEQIANQQIFQS